MEISGKHIAVLGAGESGGSAARLLLEEGARVTVLDSGDAEALREKITALEAAGGMLHLLDEASEEVALARVIIEAGYRIAAIPVPAYVVAEPASVNDATAHIHRKLITLRATDPARFVG